MVNHIEFRPQTGAEDHSVTTAKTAEANVSGVTFRVVLVSLAIAVFFAFVIPIADYRFSNTFLGATHLPPGAVAAMLLLTLVVNPLLGLVSRNWRFSRNEVLTVYLSCLFSTLVVGIGGNNYFVSFIIGSFYYATRENQWFEFLKGLPPWFTPALNPDGTYNQAVTEAWFNGLAHEASIPWGAWIVPLFAWGLFMFASFFMMGCLSVMLRAQWGKYEALSFPLLRLPLELTEDVNRDDRYGVLGRFFRNPVMWCGFGIAVAIQTVNGLHLYFPDFPQLQLSLDTAPYFSEAPWNQIGWMPLQIYPVAVGIGYLLTTEASFSLWFFAWLMKFQLMAAYSLGYPPASLPALSGTSERAFIGYQEVGAYLAYAGLILWAARRHFGHIFRRAIGREQASREERNEALSYPVAFWGFWASFTMMALWGIAAGMSPVLSILLWVSYLTIAIVLSRVVAEGGLLFVHHTWMPLGALSGLAGLGPGTLLSPGHGLATASFMEAATIQDYRASLMPSFIQSFKLAHDQGIAGRKLFGLLAAVIAVGWIIGVQMNVRLGYQYGGLTLQGWFSQWGPQMLGRNVATLSSGSNGVDPSAWLWTAIGAAATGGMVVARSYLPWFPLHPLGYIMATTYPARAFWFSILLAWLAKSLIGRFGGLEATRKLTPAFLGLALGDVSMMLFWLIVDGWLGRTNHQLMPG